MELSESWSIDNNGYRSELAIFVTVMGEALWRQAVTFIFSLTFNPLDCRH
jgi:hypothetical protein